MAYAHSEQSTTFSTLSRNGLFSGIDVISIDLSFSFSILALLAMWIKSYRTEIVQINGEKKKINKRKKLKTRKEGNRESVATLGFSDISSLFLDVIPALLMPFGLLALVPHLHQRRVCRCQSCRPSLSADRFLPSQNTPESLIPIFYVPE